MIEVKETEGKWGLYVDGVLLGTSKLRCDADQAKYALLAWRSKEIAKAIDNALRFPRGTGEMGQ